MSALLEQTRRKLQKFGHFQRGLEVTSKIRRLIKLGLSQKGFVIDGVRYKPGDEVNYDDWLSRSITYTLFLANLHSAGLIMNLDNTKVAFHYADAQLIIRSMLERSIHQRYIISDPKRLARMFVLWRHIEAKRLLRGIEVVRNRQPDSIALQAAVGDTVPQWSPDDEGEYQRAVSEWESLVIPKQEAEKAKSWAGISLAAMAEQCDMTDYYKITYRTSSWYTHGLIHVSDFYLQEKGNRPDIWEYSVVPDEELKVECYLYALAVLELSFYCADQFLHWGVSGKVAKTITDKPHAITWLVELLKAF